MNPIAAAGPVAQYTRPVVVGSEGGRTDAQRTDAG